MRWLAESLSGHDKGQVYVVWNEDESFVCLTDGRIRTIDNTKRKTRKHIREIRDLPDEVCRLLEPEKIHDTEVKRALKLWNQYLADHII